MPTAETTDRATSKAQELREQTPPDHLPEVISNLKKYLRLKRLAELSYRDLPDELRSEIGTRDPQDVFQESLDDDATADLWFELQDAYGKEWKNEELEKMIDNLENA